MKGLRSPGATSRKQRLGTFAPTCIVRRRDSWALDGHLDHHRAPNSVRCVHVIPTPPQLQSDVSRRSSTYSDPLPPNKTDTTTLETCAVRLLPATPRGRFCRRR